MLFQRINRSDPEKVFLVVKAGEALTANKPVSMHFSGTDDGLIAWRCDAAPDTSAVIGIADAAIAINEYGLVQCYGFRSAADVQPGSAHTVDNLDILTPDSRSSGGLSQSASIGASQVAQPSFICAVSASSASSAAYRTTAVFIRCM